MRILVYEDDPAIGDGLKRRLQQEGYTVDWLEEGISLSSAEEYDDFTVIILDLGLPGEDGMTILENLRHLGANTPVLILTARDSVTDRVKGLDANADDYLTKPFVMEELLARVRALARRKAAKAQKTIIYGNIKIETSGMTVHKGMAVIEFTPKIFNLLLTLVSNSGRVLTRAELGEKLYGWDGDAESNTLEVYISQIRRKLGSDIIKTVRGIGYMSPKK
ncbi:response regulator transcription factor [Kiloniella majae]|uniref:response regulator n=1 Tax=Kiloniella majae TaxID=1938558 RepID=UPI000A2777ED|nr:response regulator transcription factor [Kiloniella majae]